MTWDKIQQVLRIVIYSAGGYFLGDGVAQGEMFQAAVSGLMAVGAFAWWFFWDRTRAA